MTLFSTHRYLLLFSLLYGVIFVFCAIHPVSRAVWLAEIIPVLIVFALIWLISIQFHFSLTAYTLMFIWLIMHTIGAKYTFAEVPFDWFNQLIDSERNNYDRVAHFSIGFYAYPIAEYLLRTRACSWRLAALFALFSIMSLAASYEIIEWWYAALQGGQEGIAFLGSQGDVWDAQKDMLCDTLGALTALTLMMIQHRYGRRAHTR